MFPENTINLESNNLMAAKWKKLGLVYDVSKFKRHCKLLTHASNPTPMLLEGDTYRVFYSGRDNQNRSSIGAVDIDIGNREIVCNHPEPLFTHGPTGCYYSDGVSIGNIYEVKQDRYLLFMGWENPTHSHWRGKIGRLLIKPDHSLILVEENPILDLGTEDPFSLSYPWGMANCGENYTMWYGSTVNWDAGNGEMLHVIKRATSDDGNIWKPRGLSLPYKLGESQAFSRPTVIIEENSKYVMWFSYRGGAETNYRIGKATSDDTIEWTIELEDVGIGISESGWDSEMVEYPYVFTHNGQRYMLYNGNEFGKRGFGLAIFDRC